jgi:WD40 repeat protein
MILLPGYEDGTVERLAFSGDSRWLMSQSSHARSRRRSAPVRYWNRFNGLQKYLPWHPDHFGWCHALAPNGELSAWESGGLLHIWHAENGTTIDSIQDNPRPNLVAFSGDGSVVAGVSTSTQNTVWVRDAKSRSFVTRDSQLSLPRRLAISANGSLIALHSGTAVSVIALPGAKEEAHFTTGDQIEQLEFDPSNRYLTARSGQTLLVFDLHRPSFVTSAKAKHVLAGIAISPDGKTIATTGRDSSVSFWDLESLKERKSFSWPVHRIGPIAFAPDGLTAAVGGENGRIVIWDLDEF